MANPNPNTSGLTPWRKGQSGNPSGYNGRRSRRDVEALNRLIEQIEAEPGIAKTWLREALGDPKAGIPPNFAFFKLLIEYRNGKVKEDSAGEELEDEPATDADGNAIEP